MIYLLNFFNKKNISIVLSFTLLGIVISIYKGYGDDIDSYAMIKTFIRIIKEGYYLPSRFYGYPFGELFYGFLAFHFGSFISSFLSYIMFLSSLLLIIKCYSKNLIFDNKNLIFVLLCFSNPVLFLDNTNPSDAPLSLFLFSLGFFLYKKKLLFYAGIFFALTIATRANYGLFVYAIILYDVFLKKKIDLKIFELLVLCTLITFLFYYPAFILNKFDISFITNPGGPEIQFMSLLPRFFYKTFLSYGIYSSILIFLIYILNFNYINKRISKYKLEFILIFLNLITFLFIPTKTSIISLAIILTYLIIFELIKKKIIIFIIMSNFIFYIISYDIFDFKYKYSGKCDPIEAIGAEFNFQINDGYFVKRTKQMKNKIMCDSKGFGDKSKNYLNGKKLK